MPHAQIIIHNDQFTTRVKSSAKDRCMEASPFENILHFRIISYRMQGRSYFQDVRSLDENDTQLNQNILDIHTSTMIVAPHFLTTSSDRSVIQSRDKFTKISTFLVYCFL